MSQLKKLAGQTAIYGISSILGRTINFFLLPLYIIYLDKDALGSFTNLYAFIAFFNVVFTYGMETTFFRFYTGKGLDPKKVYAQIQSLLLVSSLILGSCIFFGSEALSIWLNYPGKAYLFKWVAAILAIDAVLAIPYAKLRVENKPLKFALSKLGNILLNVGLNILMISVGYHIWNGDYLTGLQNTVGALYQPDWGIEYILIANLIANAVMIPILFMLSGFFTFKIEWEYIKPMWKYAIPLFFMGLAGVTNEVFSRSIFEFVIPENFYPGLTPREAGGIFGANFKLAIFMSLIIQAFKFAAEPFFFNQSTDKNSPLLFAKVMHAFIIFCSLLMIMVSVNLNILGKFILVEEEYMEVMYIVPILLLGYLFLGIYFNLSIWFKLTDQTKYSFYFTLIGAIVTVIVIFIFVPKIGYMGAALSTISCYFIMSALCYFYGQRYFPIPYKLLKGLTYILLASTLSYAGFFLETENQILQFLLKNLMVIPFVILILAFEKKEIQTLFRNRIPL
ncbi:lipopolysaccharide biosynthesis protein [Belliella kenyensis]|uniref:Lipopolysaccharide biosynthesis protein n=1 Tax=Belliella kenyensis TaxID=1472724 RepID=A0ABV8EMP5_9BACT|nr:polysaccharide biosynthesis C-terminal domain-containing protein [Belliella kenyensis]MCH7400661.1 polysaccharide biosynthesis C-terminal domain-containing protein [Belliella kenyensis]MDN3602052.1 polysaccharide biosynthesis C-terminal domain-containing protein [Belliella kenyensis]